MTDDEILIIGAGACGLMAGRLLSQKGHRVTIIEARDRSGGRIWTDETTFSAPVEMGAEFIHGNQPLTMSLVQQSQTEVSEMKGKWYRLRNSKVSEANMFNAQWDEMLKEIKKLREDTDIASFLIQKFPGPEYAELREDVFQFTEGYDAADPHRVSAFALREEWLESDDSSQYRISGGYGRIINFLEKEFVGAEGKLRLAAEVVQVNWQRGKVKLHLKNNEVIVGKKVVITIPTGILQKGNPEFIPRLPFPNGSLEKLGVGGVIKFQIEFTKQFWGDVIARKYVDLAFILTDAEIPTWWLSSQNHPILTGWWGGPSTLSNNESESGLYERAIKSLAYIFESDEGPIRKQVVHWRIANWVLDQNSQGAYGYATIDSEKVTTTMREPVEDTLYFAGEALYTGAAMGTVEAALVSGRDVSKKISGLNSD
jgi:monoamine oxidase